MFTEINARLVEVQGELRKKTKYKSQLVDYQIELENIEATISQLRSQFETEKKDVDKLEGISLTSLFAALTGTKSEKLSKEKQEMVTAQHRIEEAEKTKREIDSAMLEIRNKLYLIEDAEDEYQKLFEQKEKLIKNSTSPFATKVFELSEKEGVLKAYLTELDEAIKAGKRVERALNDAITSLEKAENWGTWDMFGGGTISGIAKHQHIDQAERYLHQAQTSMRQFQKELLDVQETAHLEVDISGMLKFADFFFDGFIADYMVQGKIIRSQEQASNQYSKVKDIVRKLNVQSAEKLKELESIQQEKRGIIERL